MDSDFHLRKVQTLSPKAAKIALRILDADPGIPVEFILVLRPALVERSSESTPFGTTDWMTIAAIDSFIGHHPFVTFVLLLIAWDFVASVRSSR